MTNTKFIRCLLCTLLSVAMLLSMAIGAAAAPADSTVTDDDLTVDGEGGVAPEDAVHEGFEALTSSNGITMYVNMEDGHFYLKNDATGKEWHSTPIDYEDDDKTKGKTRTVVRSQMIISYVNRNEMSTVEYAQEMNSQSDCINEGGLTVTKLSDGSGIRVNYYYPAVGITVPATYQLVNGQLKATVLVNEIKEQPVGDDSFVLVDINLLPSFGAGNWATEGQLFIPDGCGALIDFNSGMQGDTYKSMIYGADLAIVPEQQVTYTENIRLPVFGTLIGEDALMGVVTVGDTTSSVTIISGHEKCGYNSVSSVFHYRVMQAQYNLFNKRKVNLVAEPDYGFDTYEVRYTILSGEEADYIGMAKAYRQYLIDEKGLAALEDGAKPTFHLNAVGSFEQAATFLGLIPYTDRVKLTTYEQCEEILKSLKEAGISDITLRYLGWSNNGIENVKIPKSASALGVLGGKSDLTALQEYAESAKVTFYPEVDLMTFQKSGNGISVNKVGIRTVFGKTTYRNKFMLSTYVKELGTDVTALLSPEKFSDIGGRYLTSLDKQGFKAVNLGVMGDYCYSNFYEKNEQYRSKFLQYIEAMMKEYKAKNVKMSFSGGNAYVLPYASLITDVPTHSSGYDIFSADVPFYQAVLHGYVPYTTESLPQTADPEAAYLAAVETGTELSYIGTYAESSEMFDTAYDYMYGSNYTLWQAKAAEQYKKYMPLLQKVYNQTIVDHTEVQDEVFVTEYANGVKVAVNYNDEAVTVDGVTIAARDYEEVAG